MFLQNEKQHHSVNVISATRTIYVQHLTSTEINNNASNSAAIDTLEDVYGLLAIRFNSFLTVCRNCLISRNKVITLSAPPSL